MNRFEGGLSLWLHLLFTDLVVVWPRLHDQPTIDDLRYLFGQSRDGWV